MSGKSKKTGNLVALGSAAVVAVYGVGFMRTAAAAERFVEQSDERVLSPEDAAAAATELKASSNTVPANAVAANVVPANAAQVNAAKSVQANEGRVVDDAKRTSEPALNKADATIARTNAKSAPTSSSARAGEVSVPVPPEVTTVNSPAGVAVTTAVETPARTTPPATPNTASTSTKAVSEKPAPSVVSSTAPASTPQSVTAPVTAAPTAGVTAAPSPATAPVTAPTTTTTTAATTSSATAEPNAAAAKLKDGEYTGYGTSRHGDVEVYLETTDGKITYIKISQCLTQYSCSWISDLPKQVLARQSARVDGVSGATQSANAFYYAVVQALAKAK